MKISWTKFHFMAICHKYGTLMKEIFLDINFRDFAVFDPFRKSLCPQNFSKLVVYEILYPENLKIDHRQKCMSGK